MTTIVSEHNRQLQEEELAHWHGEKPTKYFAYIKSEVSPVNSHFTRHTCTTWLGGTLGKVYAGEAYRNNFGDTRRAITVYGNNGIRYHGTWYSDYDYCRITAYKNQ